MVIFLQPDFVIYHVRLISAIYVKVDLSVN